MKNAQPDSNEQLLDTITALKEEVHVLRDTVDELRSELQWLCNNAHECNVAPTPSAVSAAPSALPTATPEASHEAPVVAERVHDVRASINTILAGDCVAGMQAMPGGSIDLVFADPPFNIGYEYDQYDDRRSPAAYLDWTRQWTAEAIRVLKPTGTLWIASGDEYAAEIKTILQEQRLACRNWVIWYYTFGTNCRSKFSRSHAHLLYMVKDPSSFTFDLDEIRVPSARQLDGDKRAHPDGRIPDDTWIVRPQDIPDSFQPDEDTWHIPRVNGTFRERQGWHTCQMPEQILARIIRTCSRPRDKVLDPFVGSGTTPAVAKKLGRRFIGFELSDDYATRARQRIDAVSEGQAIEGSDEPFVRESARRARRTESRQQELW